MESNELIKYNIVSEKTGIYTDKIESSKNIYSFIKRVWPEDIKVRECVVIFILNRQNIIIGYHVISIGGVSGSVIDIKLIVKIAVNTLCSTVIIAHNHPSGNKKPSKADIDITEKVKTGLSFFDIALLDHIILTEDEYFSFADEGIL